MSTGEYLAGAVFLLIGVGAPALAAVRLVGGAGLERLIGVGVLTAAGVFGVHLIPGMLGILSRESVAVCALLLLAVAWRFGPAPVALAPPPDPVADTGFSRACGLVAVGIVGVFLLGHAISRADEAVMHPDVISFHLPNVARWIQSGSFWQVDDFIPNRAPGNYPQTGDVFVLSAVLPWKSDFLARLVAYPFLALAGLGIYAAARELAAPASSAMLAAAAFLAMPVVAWVGGQGFADPEMLGPFAAGGFFLLRHGRTGDGFDLAVAGIGLGLAFGARWYSVPAVGAVVAVWLVARLAARQRSADVARQGAVLIGLVALFGGFWLLRNLVESGNPVFPVKVAPLGLTLFDAPHDLYRDLQGFSLADYLDRPRIWTEILLPPFLRFMGWSAVVLWVLLAVAAIVAVRRRVVGAVPALAVIAAIIGAVYVITPYSAAGLENQPYEAYANARYVVPGLIAAAPAAAWLIGRVRRGRRPLDVLLVLVVIDGIAKTRVLPFGDVYGGGLALGAAAVGGLACLWWRGLPSARTPATAVGAAAVVVVALAAGRGAERRFEDRRYAGMSPVVDRIDAAPPGRRIGILGDGFGSYPLFGPRLEHRVSYIGHRVDEMLRPYTSRAGLARAVRSGHYDFVEVQTIDTIDPGLPRRQERWLRSMGFREVAAGPHVGLGHAGVKARLYVPPGVTKSGASGRLSRFGHFPAHG